MTTSIRYHTYVNVTTFPSHGRDQLWSIQAPGKILQKFMSRCQPDIYPLKLVFNSIKYLYRRKTMKDIGLEKVNK